MDIIEQENKMIEFETPVYNVYARVDEENRVIRIFSDCFEESKMNDVLIKSGSGDEYVHVGYYQITDENGVYRYKIENDVLVERTEEEIAEEVSSLSEVFYETDAQKIERLEKENTSIQMALVEVYEMLLNGV